MTGYVRANGRLVLGVLHLLPIVAAVVADTTMQRHPVQAAPMAS